MGAVPGRKREWPGEEDVGWRWISSGRPTCIIAGLGFLVVVVVVVVELGVLSREEG